MKSPAASEIVQLRQLLAERFPHTRSWTDAPKSHPVWPTALPQLDALLQGGLPKGSITELVSAQSGTGSALLLRALLRRASQTRHLTALIDGQDSFDAAGVEACVLARLLWARCRTTDEALKAADIILRDRNLPVVILDLKMNPSAQLRKISGTTWYRLQRLVQPAGTALLVLTPHPLVGNADARLALETRFDLSALSQDDASLLPALKFDLLRWSLGENSAKTAQAG